MGVKRELGLLDVFCISSGAMISSGLFILPAIAFAKSGPFVLLAYFLAGILILPTLMSKAELVTAMPKTGGIFFFTDRSMGPAAGTLGGLGEWFCLSFKSAFALLGMGIFAMIFFPDMPMWQIKAIAVGLCVFFAVINLVGVKAAGRFQVLIVLALLLMMVGYVIFGVFFIKTSNFTNAPSKGLAPVITTAGLVFVSFAGTTKICTVAGEVKNPGRNLPIGMFLSWAIVTTLYLGVIAVTIGVVPSGDLLASLTPLSLGGKVLFGTVGLVLMTLAGILAFVSTGNAGILAASRDPLAMSRDHLLPGFFGKVSKQGTPWVAILITTGFMISIILFLDLETFVKAASSMLLILYILANMAVIFMRESNMRHYRPKFKAPFYPWLQVFGIVAYGFLIMQMGTLTHIIVGVFILGGLGWYYFYARGKIKREYALLHIVKKVLNKESSHLLDEELRELVIKRDNCSENRFENMLKRCTILDLDHFVAPEEFSEHVSKTLARKLKMDQKKLYKQLLDIEKDSNIVVGSGLAVITFQIKRKEAFEVILVRTKKGAQFKKGEDPVHAAFIVVSSPDEQPFYYQSLMWMLQISESTGFKENWMAAKTKRELRRIIINAFIDQVTKNGDLVEIPNSSCDVCVNPETMH